MLTKEEITDIKILVSCKKRINGGYNLEGGGWEYYKDFSTKGIKFFLIDEEEAKKILTKKKRKID